MDTRKEISFVTIIGDSLSDRGAIHEKKFLGFLPFRLFTSLPKKSPNRRFTNGYVWCDHLSAWLMNEAILEQFRHHYRARNDDIADAIITHERRFHHLYQHAYTFNHHRQINYHQHRFVTTFNEGGLTSHDYRSRPSLHPQRFFKRLVLTNLKNTRHKIESHEKENSITQEQKAKTLVMEWTGVNDLVTVGSLTKESVDRAIKAKINNIERLIESGYLHFYIFNMPDLSLAPRFDALSLTEKNNSAEMSYYFNVSLHNACARIWRDYPSVTLKIVDVNRWLNNIYYNAEKYGFNLKTKRDCLIYSHGFNVNHQAGRGYLYWDGVHFTSQVHILLAKMIRSELEQKYEFNLLSKNKNLRFP